MTQGGNGVPSFERDVRGLFREQDQRAMDFLFDLWDYDDVRENAELILAQLDAGRMPCDGPWPQQRVELFRRWVEGGMPR